jgi:hypothetical protein
VTEDFRVAQKSRKSSQTESHNEKNRLWRGIRAMTGQGLIVEISRRKESIMMTDSRDNQAEILTFW